VHFGVTSAPAGLTAAALALAVVTSACGDGTGRQQVTVLAASSLTDTFTDLEAEYEEAHPDADLVVSTGGSPTLAAQAAAGAPAAALITADRQSMQVAVDAGVTDGAPEPIATNAVTVATPVDPPGPEVDHIEDLADEDLLIALCAPEVPCGGAARDLLRAAGVEVEPDTLELSVQGVVTRLELGEVDAGVVYRTDVEASTRLRAVPDGLVDTVGAVRYLAAPLDGQAGGAAVVEFLSGDRARHILADHGFGAP
jgi:molybdate transport system substrate-binding protein